MKSQLIKKLLRRTGYAVFALAALVAVFILEENVRGHVMLTRYKAELRAKGEKLTLAELDLPKVPKEDNGAPALLEAASQLATLSKSNQLWQSGLWVIRFVAPGRARVLHLDAEPMNLGRPCSWDELNKDVASVSNALEKARAATQQPTLAVEMDYTAGGWGKSLHSMDLVYLRNWLGAAAVNDLRRGNLDAALENVVAMAKLTQVQKSEHVVDAQRSRLRTGAYGLQVTWEALQADGWTDRQLARLQACWQGAECLSGFVPSVEVDRVLQLQVSNQDVLRTLIVNFEFCCNDKQTLTYWWGISALKVRWLIWRVAWFDQDQLQTLRRWSENLDGARSVAKQKSWAARSAKPERPWTLYDRWRYLGASVSYTGEFEMGRAAKYETLREMAIAAIALKRYQLRAGKFPTDLSALAPEFLSALPHDWMDGKPLRYRRNPDGTFTLYSVGENGIDHGGVPSSGPVAWFLDTSWDGDQVWPQPATTEEVGAWELERARPAAGRRGYRVKDLK